MSIFEIVKNLTLNTEVLSTTLIIIATITTILSAIAYSKLRKTSLIFLLVFSLVLFSTVVIRNLDSMGIILLDDLLISKQIVHLFLDIITYVILFLTLLFFIVEK